MYKSKEDQLVLCEDKEKRKESDGGKKSSYAAIPEMATIRQSLTSSDCGVIVR
jgi:hypothetical protein